MKEMMVYGSYLCSSCIEMQEYFETHSIDYTFYDITLDLQALKRFLKLREESPIFDEVKKEGKIGIPTIIIGEEMILDFGEKQIERLNQLLK
ncbi:hypothetical protein [Garciella nitratireducens]|uniref:hypothetical protein n=1 Tax=Garciella nitratireducens TaxID=218205 RepID=UPI001BD3B34B|nr:hypothetical protein [Garciella nitratireducens]